MVRVLIVEDDMVIGFDLADQLREAALDVVGVATNSRQALNLIWEQSCDVAVLDVNLGGAATSEPVALALKARRIPFVTVSGYAPHQHPEVFRGSSLFAKPVDVGALIVAIRHLTS